MSHIRKLLIVVADGEHARFARSAAHGALHTERRIDSASAHRRAADLGADRPGASFHTGSSARHSVGHRQDPKALAKQEFAKLVAEETGAEFRECEADGLILAAPPKVLDALDQHLDPAVTARVLGRLPKDLVKVPDERLAAHFADWIPVARHDG
jgi:protein required for attachment to host cells